MSSYTSWAVKTPITVTSLQSNNISVAGDAYWNSLAIAGNWIAGALNKSAFNVTGSVSDAGGFATSTTLNVTGDAVVTGTATVNNTENATSTNTGSVQIPNGDASFNVASFSANRIDGLKYTPNNQTTTVTGSATFSKALVATDCTPTTLSASTLSTTGGLSVRKNVTVTGNIIAYLPNVCRISTNTTQSIPATTWTTLVFGTTDYDASSSSTMTTTNANCVTIPVTGYYEIQYYVWVASAPAVDVNYWTICTKNSTDATGKLFGQHHRGRGVNPQFQGSFVSSLAANDILRILMYQDNTIAATISGNAGRTISYFTVRFIGV